MAASLNLHAANTGSPTFVRGASETHIDISFVSDAIVQRLAGWRVLLDVESASYHKYIAYSIRTTAPRPNAATPEGWNWRKMDYEKLNSFLKNSICGTNVGELHEAIDEYIKRACDASMPKKKPRGARKPVFWWSDDIAELRKVSLAARKTFQRARKRRGPDECREEQLKARDAMKALRLAIKRSQESAWKALCDSVDQDPWGPHETLQSDRKEAAGQEAHSRAQCSGPTSRNTLDPLPVWTSSGSLHPTSGCLFYKYYRRRNRDDSLHLTNR